MKSILLNVKSPYSYPIVFGCKTVEFKRIFSNDIEKGTVVYIHSNGNVVGEARIESVEHKSLDTLWYDHALKGMISWSDFDSYFKGKKKGYALKFSCQRKYDEPLSLKDFNRKMKTNISKVNNYTFI